MKAFAAIGGGTTGWAEAAGLSSDYVLAYASRLSSACSRWPILNVFGYAPAKSEAPMLEEMTRTHPMVWEDAVIQVSPQFLRSDEYLGHEDLLATLGRERVEFTCAEAQPLISALADGELDGPASVALTHHVRECATCGEMLRQHRETKQSLTTLRQSIEGIADDLWARISRELRSEA